MRNRHRHAIEQAARRWRGGRREDSARTCRKILISTQAATLVILGMLGLVVHHVFACIWYYLGADDFSEECWRRTCQRATARGCRSTGCIRTGATGTSTSRACTGQ